MTEPIENPKSKSYTQRIPTNIRLEPNVKRALETYCSNRDAGLADVINGLLTDFLRTQGFKLV